MQRSKLRMLTCILALLMVAQMGLGLGRVQAMGAVYNEFPCTEQGCADWCEEICSEDPYSFCDGHTYSSYLICGDLPGMCWADCWEPDLKMIIVEVGCCYIIEE